MESHVPSSTNPNESWTDEKHVLFLNSMEAWFVRTMLDNNNDRFNLRLDRHLPDSCESTLDCKQNVQSRKKHATSAVDFIGTSSRSKMKGGRLDKRSRRQPPSQPHDSLRDQVVPQIENRSGDHNDEKDLPKCCIHGTSKLI